MGSTGLKVVIALVVALGLVGYIVQLRGEIATLESRLAAAQAAPPSASAPAPAAAPAQPAAAPARAASIAELQDPRTISEVQQTIMIETLSSDGYNNASPVWFATVPNNPEAAAYQKILQSVFEAAGWQVKGNAVVGFAMKPGVFIFAADEFPPQYVNDLSAAFEASGVPLASNGRGYREYYNERKAESPEWIGFKMDNTQDFVIAIGRQPPS